MKDANYENLRSFIAAGSGFYAEIALTAKAIGIQW